MTALELKQRTATAVVKCKVMPGVRFADPVWFSATCAGGTPAFRLFGEYRTRLGFYTPRDKARSVAEALAGLRTEVRCQTEALDEPGWYRITLTGSGPTFKTTQADLGIYMHAVRFEVRSDALDSLCAGFLPYFQPREV